MNKQNLKKKGRTPVCFHLNKVQTQGLFARSKIMKEWAASDLLFYLPRCIASILWSQGCWILRRLCTFAWNNIVGLRQSYLDSKWPDHQWQLDVTEWCVHTCHSLHSQRRRHTWAQDISKAFASLTPCSPLKRAPDLEPGVQNWIKNQSSAILWVIFDESVW